MFGFVTLIPRGDSNIKESTQYIDEIEPDSPVPFNIPIEFDDGERAGKHDITIEVTYKDSMRTDHSLTYDTTIDVGGFTIIDNDSDNMSSSGMIVVIAVIIAGLVGFVIYKKKKSA